MRTLLFITIIFLLGGCTGTPKGVRPVDNFSLDRYLGKWYEIARLDHSFERGLDKVSAEYTLRDDGGVKVINRGFSSKDNQWKEAEGKAYFVTDKDKGHLKVSFFGPFYGSYVVFELDKEAYQYAFVASYNTSYLWLLSRTPTVSQELIEKFIKKSKKLGFNTDELILVTQGNSTEIPVQSLLPKK
jgi:apolipoprotein D and lipocalin family protein